VADQDEPEAEPPEAAEAAEGAGAGAGAAGGDRDGERDEAAEQPDPFRSAVGGLGDGEDTGGARTARAAQDNLTPPPRTITVGGDNQYFEGNYFFVSQAESGGPTLVDGPVPGEELERLNAVYLQAPGYARMKQRLRAQNLLVLCGEPGSGRVSTALALLAEVAPDGVNRLDPATDLRAVGEGMFKEGTGYLLEPPDEEHTAPAPQPAGGPPAPDAGPTPLTEMHLDRLSAQLAKATAFAVIVVGGDDQADRLLRGRYGFRFVPPPTRDVLRRHLRERLRDAPAGSFQDALARRADVHEALGLEELRPAEAAHLADHLARRQLGELTDEELRAACSGLVTRQARLWLAGADRPGHLPTAMPAIRTAAFRIAVAVFNGSPYGLAAQAADELAWKLGITLDPENPPGRRLFGTHAELRPALARAELSDGEVDLGLAQAPARIITFQGKGLATAVLREVWDGHHAARGPVGRWLRELCDDPRPQVWVRAAVAAGVLCSWDWIHGYGDIVRPMALGTHDGPRFAVATVLAQAAYEPTVQPAVGSLLKQWAKGEDPGLREAAVVAHGHGLAAGSVAASLDELGKAIRRDEDGTLLVAVSFSVARLLAGPEPEAVIERLGRWLGDGRRAYVDLVLLTMLRAIRTPTTFLWGLRDNPELERRSGWTLAGALIATRPDLAAHVADLVGHALATPRSAAPALDAMGSWIRRAATDEKQLAALGGFLPRLAAGGRDRDRLRHLLDRQVRDPDRPLDRNVARRLWRAAQEGVRTGE
jgi:hypothetical protein